MFWALREMQSDPRWKNNLLFNEYFHGDTGAGLGATHQTGGRAWWPIRSGGSTIRTFFPSPM